MNSRRQSLESFALILRLAMRENTAFYVFVLQYDLPPSIVSSAGNLMNTKSQTVVQAFRLSSIELDRSTPTDQRSQDTL